MSGFLEPDLRIMRVAFAHTCTPTLTTLAPAMRHCKDFKVRIRGAVLEGLELLIF